MATVLLIDDEEQVRTLFRTALEESGFRVLSAEHGKQGLSLFEREQIDLVLVDIFMPGMDGLELIQLLRSTRPDCKIVAMSGGSGDWNYLDAAQHLGANATLKKPFSLQELLETVSTQLQLKLP